MALPKRSRTLLLLPPPPSTASYAALKTAYNEPISSVLRELNGSTRNAQGQALLEIALPFPGGLHGPRASHYTHVQQLVANLYKLICITASRGGIDTETHNGIDTRVLLVTLSKDGEVTSSKESSESAEQGPVVSLQALARCERKWDTVYSTPQGGDLNLSILQKFRSVCNSEQNYKQTQGSTAVQTEDVDPSASSQDDAINHNAVAVGGTFDHLHIGHKLLLTMFAFVLSQNTSAHQPQVLTVGITGDALLVNKKYAEHLESWKRRQESTHDFLSSLIWFGRTDDPRVATKEINEPGPNGHAVHVTYPTGLTIRYVEIADPFGPTITDQEITALVLSLETRGGGEAVNNKRKEQGWAPLEVFEVDVLDASEEDNVDDSFQSKLSSTEIRRKRSERLQSRSKA